MVQDAAIKIGLNAPSNRLTCSNDCMQHLENPVEELGESIRYVCSVYYIHLNAIQFNLPLLASAFEMMNEAVEC